MWNTDEVVELLRMHRQTPRTDFRIVRSGLIGAFGRGEQTEESDIDLLFEFEPGSDGLFNKTITLRHLLQASFPREVDICREEYAKLHLRSRFLKEAIYA